MAIVGQREKEERKITLRERDGKQSVLALTDAIAALSMRR